jgi:glucan phosphoethanolaminetransferase (alkaline phosphatase superfamily)
MQFGRFPTGKGSVLVDPFLNIFFLVFHTAFILFVLFGWIWRKARKVHLAALVLTALSWFGLGIFYGFGYCFCTDWHWTVRHRLGYPEMPRSYIKFIILAATGWDLNDKLVDAATAGAFLGVFILAVYLAVAKRRRGNAS